MIISGSDISDTVIITQKGVELFTINATPDSVQAGIVEGSGKYKIGKSVSLVAKSNSGWKFNGWYEKQLFVSEDSVFIFVVTCSRELIAKFEQIYTDINFNEPLPDNYNLSQNYPNPFNPTTKIQYSIPSAGQNDILTNNIKLSVYDALGKEVTTLVNEHKSAGTYEVTFNASQLPSGIYYYELIAGNFIQTRKMVLMK
ncbi:MAG: T9SS type A sorting domain-containing protein [Ignavibacteriales bacterium]|nr:T9SS type A sorting domain-containing protein [Ignavibacteriales bacterium]